jgi:uncharacterized protein YfaA (DUF2138 family)
MTTPATDAVNPNPIPSKVQTPTAFWRHKGFLAIIIILLCGAAVWGWYRWRLPVQFDNQAEINLGVPDVWIHSQNLALLPHDILQVPLLKSVLTEDFLYFYQQDADWLSLQGALRRLSFEHNLSLSDSLLKNIADAPTDVYFWHDGSHALRYWAVSIERDQLLTLAQKLAQLKLVADKQMTEVGRVKVDGKNLPLFKIALSAQRSMAVIANGKRLVLFSDSDMLTRAEGQLDPHAAQLVASLLSSQESERKPLVAGDQAPIITKQLPQTIWLSNRFYAQGYAAFLPDVQALRFDFDGSHWSGQANVRHIAADSHIWTQLPAYAATCFSTSIDWTQVEAALTAAKAPMNDLIKSKQLESLSPTGAVCWYSAAEDDIAQPLFVALRTDHSSSKPQEMNALFDWGVAHNRDYEAPILELKAQKRSLLAQANQLTDDLKKLKKDRRQASKNSGSNTNLADALKSYDDQIMDKQNQLVQLTTQREDLTNQLKLTQKDLDPAIQKAQALTTQQIGSFTMLSRTQPIVSNANPTLAFNDQVIYFSPNQDLVKRAMSVANQRYPNLQEQTHLMDPKQNTLLYVSPAKLAKLITQTGHRALPQKTNRRLRDAFDYHMPARMSALAQEKPFVISVSQPSVLQRDTLHWQPLTWTDGQ